MQPFEGIGILSLARNMLFYFYVLNLRRVCLHLALGLVHMKSDIRGSSKKANDKKMIECIIYRVSLKKGTLAIFVLFLFQKSDFIFSHVF